MCWCAISCRGCKYGHFFVVKCSNVTNILPTPLSEHKVMCTAHGPFYCETTVLSILCQTIPTLGSLEAEFSKNFDSTPTPHWPQLTTCNLFTFLHGQIKKSCLEIYLCLSGLPRPLILADFLANRLLLACRNVTSTSHITLGTHIEDTIRMI